MKVKFTIDRLTGQDSKIVEYDDDTTESEIMDDLDDWVLRMSYYDFEIIEESKQK